MAHAALHLADEVVRSLRAASDTAALHDIVADAARYLGFRHFALITHEDLAAERLGQVDIRNYPAAVADRIMGEGRFRRDPVIRGCLFSDSAFLWSDLGTIIQLNRRDRHALAFGCAHGLTEGITIPCFKWGRIFGSCTFAGKVTRSRAARLLGPAQMIGIFAFQRARQLTEEATPIAPQPRLNPRPRDCVVLAGKGLSNKAIARSLNISPSTVDRYLKDARRAFNVGSRAELLWAAMLAGEVDPGELR